MNFDEPLLTAAQERALAREIEAGIAAGAVLAGVPGCPDVRAEVAELQRLVRAGERAHDRFVRANLRLVAQIAAREAARCGLNRDELFQEGVVGLLEALRRWDHRRELRFTTYAVTWIRNLVQGAAANRLGELNVNRRSAAVLHSVRGVAREIEAGGMRASPAAVAQRLGVRERTARAWLDYAAPVALGDALAVLPVAAENAEPPPRLDGLLARLEERQRAVVELRYGFCGPPLSQQQVAERWSCSVRQVQRVEAAALAELRGWCPAELAAA